MNFKLPTAIVVGTESSGLSETWINAADYNVIIPMGGQVDSMNVSVSAAILLFEAVRQRKH
jgi:TrmH family RNA methyltransferase